MCEHQIIKTPPSDLKRGKARPAIWDLPAHHRCPVVGTCLEVAQLKKLKTRFQDCINEDNLSTDYELHSYFVAISSTKNIVSTYINKWLDKKYQRFINKINSLKDNDAIEAQWNNTPKTELKTLAGLFWAILSSKYACDGLKEYVYGEMHMISHIAGQSDRTDIHALVNEKKSALEAVEKKERTIAAKNQRLQAQKEQINQLKQQNSELLKNYQQLLKAVKQPTAASPEQEKKIADQQTKIAHLETQLAKKSSVKPSTIPAQEVSLNQLIAESPTAQKEHCGGDCKTCSNSDLCGKKILYVGGFSRHRRKFQKMTHSINGEFFYHDGGKQQSSHLLDNLVQKADCIFCPIDCISHDAIGRVKTLAKTHCKDCIFLRSASLSSFHQEIKRYAC